MFDLAPLRICEIPYLDLGVKGNCYLKATNGRGDVKKIQPQLIGLGSISGY